MFSLSRSLYDNQAKYIENNDELSEKQKTKLLDKNKKRQQTLAIVETAFHTGKSIMRAVADIPAPYGLIQAGIHGAMGIAQIANIKSERIGGTDSSSTDTPDTMTPSTTGAFTLGGALPDQEPVKAYVVTDEMSDSQAQLSDIRRRSTI